MQQSYQIPQANDQSYQVPQANGDTSCLLEKIAIDLTFSSPLYRLLAFYAPLMKFSAASQSPDFAVVAVESNSNRILGFFFWAR